MFQKLKELVAPKAKAWEGMSVEEYEINCKKLEEAGIYHQSFQVNLETPKCDGKCGSCLSRCNFDENTETYEKIGVGISDNLLKDKPDYDMYAIYVLESEIDRAKEVLGVV